MLTFSDLQEIGKLIDERFKQFYEDHIKYIPTKDAFFARMDMLTKEIKESREELAAHSISHDRLTENDEELDLRIQVLEKKVGIHAQKN